MLQNFFGVVLGFVSGLLTAIWIEWIKLPRLRIAISPHSDQHQNNSDVRFLYVSVTNAPMPKAFRRLIARASALSCYARIEFLNSDESTVFPRPMDARWSESPQPSELSKGGRVYQSDIETLRYRDIHTNRSERLDVAIKFADEEDCYGFTNTSFVQGVKDPTWKLPKGRYLVQITVYTGSYVASERFVLRNDWPKHNFCLEPMISRPLKQVE